MRDLVRQGHGACVEAAALGELGEVRDGFVDVPDVKAAKWVIASVVRETCPPCVRASDLEVVQRVAPMDRYTSPLPMVREPEIEVHQNNAGAIEGAEFDVVAHQALVADTVFEEGDSLACLAVSDPCAYHADALY